MTYVIHGATGAQGAPLAALLAAANKPVVAIARNAGATVDNARVVVADYSSITDLAKAYCGAEGVFVHLPLGAEDDRRTYAHNIVAAVGEARPQRVVVSTSGAVVDDPGSPLQEQADSAISTLISGLEDIDVSHAVIAPRMFLENLLLPSVIESVGTEGTLRYPLTADFTVSWASHLDVADTAAALFAQPDVTGVVSVGHCPAITGPDLAEAFSARLGRDVAYEAISPAVFGTSIASLIGAGAAARVAGLYQTLATLPDNAISPESSAQKLLGLVPRTVEQWLADIGM
ncbi:NAD(P)H-binding protein [Streptomyces sp. NPDC052092]|uniref:NmrA family NAD(P)-binding protein n=1 Tax=Streptomyces sp. NPDC052092 TaxID=3365685 RepID=UPI0037D8ECF2